MTDLPYGRVDFDSPVVAAGGLEFAPFERIIEATAITAVRPAVEQLEAAVADGWHALGFVCYEAAPAFDPALQAPAAIDLPLLWFGLSREPLRPAPAGAATVEFSPWQPAWEETDYTAAFHRVQQHIRDGDTYQLNLTFPLTGTFAGSPRDCYQALRTAQSSKYCAMLQTEDWSVVSASPELFFEKEADHVRTRPMKGTRPRGMTTAEDRAIAAELRGNPKDRAENVMIVDLLRNDLGRVARHGSVAVPELYATEKYPTVWQMTSTVTADLRPELSLFALFAGIFPCGSVTGAPKVKTMEIIAREEAAGRGVYCGAVGYLRPGGDAVFNVAIRTLTLQRGKAVYPVGSGLVADSDAAAEYAECLVKAAVLTRQSTPAFDLLETLRWTPDDGYILLDRHLDRVLDAAAYFDRPAERKEVLTALTRASTDWTEQMRVRLLLAADGQLQVESTVMSAAASPFTKLKSASAPISRTDPFLYHKTTHREVYAAAAAERTADTDVLLYNEAGEITESTIANVAVCFHGTWYTPPVHCGLLAGTMRRDLLDRGEIQERVIRLEEMADAEGVRLMNSVRGQFDVEWVG